MHAPFQQRQPQRSFATMAQQTPPILTNNNASVLDNAKFSLARWFADRILPFKKTEQAPQPRLQTQQQRIAPQKSIVVTTTPSSASTPSSSSASSSPEVLVNKESVVSTCVVDLTKAITDVIDETSRMSLSTTASTAIEKQVFTAVLEATATADEVERKLLLEPKKTEEPVSTVLPFQTRYSQWKSEQANELEGQLLQLDCNSKILETVPELFKQTISSKIEAKVEDIVKTSSNLLKECVLVMGGLPKDATMAEKVRLRRLMEFCSSIHERTAQRAILFKQLMEKDTMQAVSEASLSEAPTEAAKDIQQKLTTVLDTSLGRLDSMVQDLDASAATIIAALKTNPSDVKEQTAILLRKRKVIDSAAMDQDPPQTQLVSKAPLPEEAMDWTSSRKHKKRKMASPRSRVFRPLPRLPPSPSSSLKELCILRIRENILNMPNLQFRLPEELLQQVISNLVATRAISYETLERVLSPFSQILNLDNCVQITNSSCSLVARTCRQLRKLSLSGCTNISSEGLTEIAHSVPYLEVLNLEGCHGIGDASLLEIGKRCPLLRSLNLRGCSQVTEVGLSELMNLQELDLSELPSLTERGLKNFLGRCFNLVSLKLSGKNVSNDSIEILAVNCPELSTLELVSCENLTDAAVRALSTYCKKLQTLSISFCKGIAFASFLERTRQDVSPLFPHLTEIDLTRSPNFNDTALNHLSRRCPRLQVINASSCEEITDAGVGFVATNLKHLLLDCNFSNCSNVNDASVLLLAENCSNLRRLSLYNCHGVTDAAIEVLADRCKDLISLDLSSCEKVTDRSLVRLAQKCQSLEVLSVEETTITNDGLLEVARSCRSLNTLKLAYCKGLMDAGLTELARGCPEMKHLDLSYCNNLTLTAIQRALDLWPKLEELHLRGLNAISSGGLRHPRVSTINLSWCKNLEDVAVEELGRGCPSLTDLDLAWCPKLSGNVVNFLAQECHLSTVNLRGCVNIQVKSTKRLSSTMTIYR